MSHHEIKFLIFRTFIKFYSNEFLKSQDTVQGDDWSERKKGKNKLQGGVAITPDFWGFITPDNWGSITPGT